MLRRDCSWDQQQTLKSLEPYLVEECSEVLEALRYFEATGNSKDLIDELGDLLFQIVFQAEILGEHLKSSRQSVFSEIVFGLCAKLKRRHPHIFDQKADLSPSQVENQWEDIKKREKGEQQADSWLGEIPPQLPALQHSQKLGKRSKKFNFDWSNTSEVVHQTALELDELQRASHPDEKEEEFGDLLFCLAQWARHEGIDAERALRKANYKFKARINRMQSLYEKDIETFKETSPEEKEQWWKKAKESLQQHPGEAS